MQVDVPSPQEKQLDVEVEFTVTRKPVFADVDPKQVGQLTDEMKTALAADLAKDAPHMEVSDKIVAMATEVCQDETNLATQASLLMDHVAKVADHYSYSKDPDMPKCGIGDAVTCLAQKGGCCTDLHSLFIALAAARGIPAHLSMGYRLKEANRDKLADPGYRCWVEYFLPNYGWVSADIVEGDTPMGLGFALVQRAHRAACLAESRPRVEARRRSRGRPRQPHEHRLRRDRRRPGPPPPRR